MEKKMENEMETGIIWELMLRDVVNRIPLHSV